MAGSCSPSNLTANGHQYWCFSGGDGGAAAVARVLGVVGGKGFSHTVDDGTNDLVDSSIVLDAGSAGEALGQSERRLDGLEGALQSSRATEGGGPH
jgi:hypothetical protein